MMNMEFSLKCEYDVKIKDRQILVTEMPASLHKCCLSLDVVSIHFQVFSAETFLWQSGVISIPCSPEIFPFGDLSYIPQRYLLFLFVWFVPNFQTCLFLHFQFLPEVKSCWWVIYGLSISILSKRFYFFVFHPFISPYFTQIEDSHLQCGAKRVFF